MIPLLLVRPGFVDPENGSQSTGVVVVVAAVARAIASVVVRFRRASHEERLQLRWFCVVLRQQGRVQSHIGGRGWGRAWRCSNPSRITSATSTPDPAWLGLPDIIGR